MPSKNKISIDKGAGAMVLALVSPVGGPHSTRKVETGNYELRLLGAWPSAKIIAKTLKRP